MQRAAVADHCDDAEIQGGPRSAKPGFLGQRQRPSVEGAYLEMLYRKYGGALRAYLIQMLPASDVVQDLTMDTLEKMQRMYSSDQVEFPRALMFKIALNFVRMYARHQRMVYRVLGSATDVNDADSEGLLRITEAPDREAMREEVRVRLIAAIKRLPPMQHEVFVLGQVDEHSRAEIARRMNRSEKRVDKLMGKALKKLRNDLEREGVSMMDVL